MEGHGIPPKDLSSGARGKWRGVSPEAAARHSQSATVHTDSFLHARVHTASTSKTLFFSIFPTSALPSRAEVKFFSG